MQPKFKVGDKVKCIKADNHNLTYGEIYKIAHIRSGLIYLEGFAHGFNSNRFELVKSMMTIEEQAIQGLKWIKNKTPLWNVDMDGEKSCSGVDSINRTSDSCILLIESEKDCESCLCSEFFRKHGAHVAMSGNGFTLPIPLLFELPQQLETKLNGYDVVVSRENLKVGCQIISWEKFDEIVKMRKEIQTYKH